MFLNRQNGGLLVGFAALAAVVVALQPKPAGPTSSANGEKRGEERKASLLDDGPSAGPVPEGPTKPVWDFLGLAPSKASAPTKRYAVELSRKGMLVIEEPPQSDPGDRFYDWPTCCALEGFSLRFLIATVPDPVDSGFAYSFDQIVEALQRALEADDYVIDRTWLPWKRAGAKASADLRLHERHPGLVLFRDDSDPATDPCPAGPQPRRLLALLLVGETPTAGIHKSAFANAVRLIHSCPGDKKEGNRIRVLGPCFSGSAVSLGLALHEARKSMNERPENKQLPEPWIKVVCGGASGFAHDPFVRNFKDGGWRDYEEAEEEPAFASTILPNDVLLHWVRKYLGNPAKPADGTSPAPIVVLHEANTSFGQYSIGIPGKNGSNSPRTELFLVPFPLHISQLRASYTKEQLTRAESQGLPRSGRNLPFPSEHQDKEDAGRVAIAARDPLITAAIDDLVLDNLILTMAQKRARYTCLVSTDVRDTIFLAQVIRDRHPDVQLVLLGGDLLLTHEDYNYAMRGAIVASTYPLYPSVQGWSDLALDRQRSPRILFAQESHQGCYNAALVHLAATGCPKKLLPFLMDYGWEGTSGDVTMPPLWISVVAGNGQLVPVAHVAPEKYARESYSAGDPLRFLYRRPRAELAPEMAYGRLTIPNAWFLFFTVFLIGNIWCFGRACRYLRDSHWDDTAANRCSRYKQRADFAVGCLAQVLLYGQIAELAWTPLRVDSFRRDPLVSAAMLVVLVASLVMTVVPWLVLLRAHRQEIRGWEFNRRRLAYREMLVWSPPMRGWPSWLGWLSHSGFWIFFADVFMLVLVSFTVACFAVRNLAVVLTDLQPGEVLRFERLVNLFNGVSPLLPRALFCVTLFAWSFFLVKKMYLANHYSIACPAPCNGKASFQGLRNLDKDVRSELMPPSTLQKHFGWCFLILVLLLIAFGKHAHDATSPVDGVGFGRLALLGFFAGSFLLLFTLLQFHFAWRSLRKMLRFVALLPMQNAFERLDDKVIATFGHYLFSRRPRHSHLSILVQQFHRVRRLFPAFRAKLQHPGEWRLDHGPLDAATLEAAWQEVQMAFPESQFGPPVAQQFDRELNPVREEDLEPPAGSLAREWGGVTGEDIHRLARRCLRVLYPLWSVHSMEEAFGRTPHAGESAEHLAHASVFLSLPEGDAVREWAIAAEDFVAMEIIRYLSQFIVQLRTLLTCLTFGSLLLVLAATVYPFSPQQRLLLFLMVVAGGIALFILTFLIQLNRDELVSRITRSTPNRFTLDWSFLQSAATYVLPILVGLMVQFPLVTSTLRSLLDPLFHIIK